MATTGSEDDDSIEFDLSTAFATDSSDWNDLPISPALAAPSFKTYNSTIQGIDEFHNEERTQDIDDEWAPRNANPCNKDLLSFSDGEEEFLSQDLPPQYLTSSIFTKDTVDAQGTGETASSDQDMDFFEESQDDEFPFMSLSNADDLSQLPIEDPDQRSSQEQPSNLPRRHESTLSDLKRMISEDMDFRFDSNDVCRHLNFDETPDEFVVCGAVDEDLEEFVLDFDM